MTVQHGDSVEKDLTLSVDMSYRLQGCQTVDGSSSHNSGYFEGHLQLFPDVCVATHTRYFSCEVGLHR